MPGTTPIHKWFGAELRLRLTYLAVTFPPKAVLKKFGRMTYITNEVYWKKPIVLKAQTCNVVVEMNQPILNTIIVCGSSVLVQHRIVIQCHGYSLTLKMMSPARL